MLNEFLVETTMEKNFFENRFDALSPARRLFWAVFTRLVHSLSSVGAESGVSVISVFSAVSTAPTTNTTSYKYINYLIGSCV